MGEETFGQVLRRLRGDRTLEAVAKAAGIATSYVHKLENGLGIPSRKVLLALEAATNAQGALIGAAGKDGKQSAHNEGFLPSTAKTSAMRTLDTDDAFGEDATNRRRLLGVAAGLGISALTPTEALRQLINLDLPTPHTVDDWERACADHLIAVRTRPPAEVQQDLHFDLLAAHHQLHDIRTRLGAEDIQTRGMYRVVAALAAFHANVLSRLAHHGEALSWWRTAERSADASGDIHLRLGIRGTQTGHILGNSQLAPDTVLNLTRQAEQLAGDSRSYGTAFILCSQAKALTLLGHHEDAYRVLARCRDIVESDPARPTIMPSYWRGGQLEWTDCWVHAGAGDEDAMAAKRDQVLASTSDYQYRTSVDLLVALSTVASGGVDAGLQQVATVLDEVEPAYRTHEIAVIAQRTLRAVPMDQQDRPAVRDVRSLLAIEA
ncbi:helix-turn-helix transcriptional regulator [Nonomuraea sp. NPDC050404]|uniref:helix-turn-helix domain-containing protein n=1 Tax=Nonomuraea sp. NPDC050404 TaxID=3155783 RepID=UPI0033F7BCB5